MSTSNELKMAEDQPQEKRMRRYGFLYKFFADLMAHDMKFHTVAGIPVGAEFRGLAHDFTNNTLWVFVEHESFAPVPVDAECPIGYAHFKQLE